MPRAAGLAAVLAIAVGCQGPPADTGVRVLVDADPGAPDAEWMQSITLAPGQFLEANLLMGIGGEVTAAFSTQGGPVSWNLHRHTGDMLENVEVLDGGGGDMDTLSFTATEAGAYSYLWENQGGGAVQMSVQLGFAGDVRLYGWN